MIKFCKKLARYSSELNFVRKNSLDWATRVRLGRGTARFHLHNALGTDPNLEATFLARLHVGGYCNAQVTLRPFAGDIFVLFEVLMDQCYNIPDVMLDPGKVGVILDCGANIGIASLFLASRYPNAHIYSIEPNSENFELLRRNTNSMPSIVPIHGAIVGCPRKSVHLTADKAAWGNAITEKKVGPEVPAFTIDQICNNYQLSRVDLLKMDIEGTEKEIFANGSFMRRVSFVIIELHGDYDVGQFSKNLASWSFSVKTPKDVPDLKMVVAKRMCFEHTEPAQTERGQLSCEGPF